MSISIEIDGFSDNLKEKQRKKQNDIREREKNKEKRNTTLRNSVKKKPQQIKYQNYVPENLQDLDELEYIVEEKQLKANRKIKWNRPDDDF